MAHSTSKASHYLFLFATLFLIALSLVTFQVNAIPVPRNEPCDDPVAASTPAPASKVVTIPDAVADAIPAPVIVHDDKDASEPLMMKRVDTVDKKKKKKHGHAT
ncbi:hypothetical protein BGZ98_005544, partial [Dissophora globulifera]